MKFNKQAISTVLAFASLNLLNPNHCAFANNEVQLNELIDRMEAQVSAFAKHMESLISAPSEDKCTRLAQCSEMNFDGCKSEFLNAECPGSDYSIKECGSGKEGGCGGIFDFQVSKTTIAPSSREFNGDISDHHVIDDVCSTLPGEEYMVDFHNSAEGDVWKDYGVNPPWLYYGSSNGVFRMYPAAPDSQCDVQGEPLYDPRKRPWYVSASSGPKDIVLVLDTSGSMGSYQRMDKLKAAANRVIDTLNAGDFFAIVEFNSEAYQLGSTPNLLSRALDSEKATYRKLVNGLRDGGGTNYNAGFKKAFDILENTGSQDMTSNCRQAILFVSDGENNDPTRNNPILYDYVQAQRAKYTAQSKEPPFIFTYSFGDSANEEAPKALACDNQGIWAAITDAEDLSESMGAYYKYFSYGLSDAVNSNFVAWTPPYEFFTGGGLGITVSAPVYNRNTNPPIMSGVVGMDFLFAAMETAFGSVTEEARDEIIQKIVDKSRARCPSFGLDGCQIEALRQATSAESMCDTCNVLDIPDIENPICADASKFNLSLWQNSKTKWWSYEERTCCNVGENRAIGLTQEEAKDQMCKEKSLNVAGVIAGGVIAGVVVLAVVVYFVRRRRNSSTQHHNIHPNAFPIAIEEAVTPVAPPPPFAPK
ncbi:hypothetical protein CTEN210_09591 [Chaetoceros tenuissimus]|uniref:VWFA domain-containing protein n=1 Tax=Chaetoceros tenuissimus TaxID=426638 RepID=A0AAD3CY39_9STRA|nr:hypothetical protein CTEN210_09591 [Chaetoceros tenuissimus]